jgi:hypothetical protein
MMNLDMVTHVCACGGNMWKIWAIFQDYEIAAYGLDMECMDCGSRAKAPTPLDRPDEGVYA